MANNTTVKLYSCTCDRKVLNKMPFLGEGVSITGTFRIKEPCSISNPVIELASSTVKYKDRLQLDSVNYAFIELFQRYYFIDNIIFEHDGLLQMHMSVDVLNTYRSDILSSQQEVIRSESINTPQYVDNERPIFFDRWLDASASEVFGMVPESQGQGSVNYYLTVSGG